MRQPEPDEAPVRPAGGTLDSHPGRTGICTDTRRPAWVRPALAAILLAAATLYVWGLSNNGTANDYYTAAVISGSRSWSAAFFGSLDTAGFITIDKPPLSLWLMIASVRMFGYSPWSMLLPQALAGVATVAALYATVRRPLGYAAGLIAALVAAFTPIVSAVNRWNTPDTLLVLLLVLAAWAITRAIESGNTLWVLASMVLVGLGFNTKMLQAWMVVPALGVAYLLAGKPAIGKRVGQLALAAVVLVVVSASWMVVVDSIPADRRPYIGGSDDNSVMGLVMGHNGLARIFRGGGGAAGPGGTEPDPPAGLSPAAPDGALPSGSNVSSPAPHRGPGFSGEPSVLRLFNGQMGDQISWLLPAASLALVFGIIACGLRSRTDQRRAAFVLWGTWLATHAAVFSLSSGIIHEYYTNAMAPAIGALVGGGAVAAWGWMRNRESIRSHIATALLAASIVVTGIWNAVLLSRVPDWNPWLAPLVMLLSITGAAAVLIYRYALNRGVTAGRIVAAIAVTAVVLAPAAYATTPLSAISRDPTAGPASARQDGPGGAAIPDAGTLGPDSSDHSPAMATGAAGTRTEPRAGRQGLPGDPPPRYGPPSGDGTGGRPAGYGAPTGPPPQTGPAGTQIDPNVSVDPGLIDYLIENRSGETWIAAATGSFSAAPIIIATGGEPVMAMGGFGGNDPAPTPEELAGYVASGEVRFVVMSSRGPGGALPPGDVSAKASGAPRDRANSSSADRLEWVVNNCELVSATEFAASKATGNDGATSPPVQLYDCAIARSQPARR